MHLALNLLEPFRILALEQRNGKRLGAVLRCGAIFETRRSNSSSTH
ncbi:hypothetical protein CES85_3077 (plasmid) [Ochrobactrum quorumnocens]|uniref:Uncharacterized protein n=1 Tax=Ochrobactrum quorumnocens TaxID=271865 RepID=A0A248UNP0_9HYPH|nr:hypothetical protein CES85_3077 [[Ochrobactrum] quorumnocens]